MCESDHQLPSGVSAQRFCPQSADLISIRSIRHGQCLNRLFAIDDIANCACHQVTGTSAGATCGELNHAATLRELQIARDAMSLDA